MVRANEWVEHELADYVTCIRGVSYDGSSDLYPSENNDSVRLLRSNNIQNAKFIDSDIQYVKSHRVKAYQRIEKDDIMVCMANGSKALVGKNCIFKHDMRNAYTFGAFMSCIRRKSPDVNMDYIFALLNSSIYWENIATLLSGSSINNLRPSDILGMRFRFPDENEQHAIATALSDMDTLISNLEKLISKNNAIKQGAMLELLSGEKRLPGYDGEWIQYRLSDIGVFRKGAAISRDESHTGTIPAVRYGELYTHHDFYVKKYNSYISEEVAARSKKLKYGDIVFTASGETKEDIGKSAAILTDDAYAGGDLFIYTMSIENNPIFMGFLLDSPSVRMQKAEKAQGDAVVHIHADSLAQITVRLPEVNEQNAIANILYDMDQEISALQSKLEKYQQLKQGMMQKLLTGEIRLV